MSRLLEGYRVLESSMLLNGAGTGMLLADLGADVIKIESPTLGDYLRLGNQRPLHLQANKGKRSIALDLKQEDGREILYRLLETADVFLTNAVGQRNDRLGIGYEQLRTRKPSIVYCQNTGFGATGPYAELPTHGQMMDAMAGAIPAESGEDGLTRPSSAYPTRLGTLLSGGEGTATGAVYAAMHIAAGLAQCARSGEGCYIDVSSADAVIANAWVGARSQYASENHRRGSNPLWTDEGRARYQSYETRDGKFVLFCPEEAKFWTRFCELLDRRDLVERTHGEDLRRELQEILGARTQQDWMDFAVLHSLPIGPAHDGIDEVLADPQLRSREIFHHVEDPESGEVLYIGQPAVVAGQPYEVTRQAPELGEHTNEILRELGYGGDDVRRFAQDYVTTAPEGAWQGDGYGVYGGVPEPKS
jgi:crotonobetainyl-CoA:carnitine CoA-transferase CaiB-like acyl-CoA transferase